MGDTMKRLLLGSTMLLGLAAAAAAADLPVYTKAPPPPPMWSWSGFYIGVQGGAGWGTTEDQLTAFQNCGKAGCGPVNTVAVPDAFRSSYTLNGLHAGGTAGFNWQTGRIVFGVEGDISGADIDGSGDCSTSFGNPSLGFSGGCHSRLTWFGTLTGRLGVTVEHALVYIKAGGAWGHYNRDATVASLFNTITAVSTFGDNRSGFTVGTGIEYAVWGNWSAKVEYDYLDFGTKSLAIPTFAANGVQTGALFENERERVHVVRAGLNYRFDWGGMPLVARY
jgi:outer membrane immunogenic protein